MRCRTRHLLLVVPGLVLLASLLPSLAPSPSTGARLGPGGPVPKDVAAPPEDLLSGRLRLPAPAETAGRSAAALLPVRWTRTAEGGFVFEERLPLAPGARGELEVALLSLEAARARLEAAPLDSRAGRGALAPAPRRDEVLETPVGPARLAAWSVDAPGEWRLRATAPTAAPATLLVADGAPYVLAAHLGDWELVAGRPLPVVAWLERRELPGSAAPLVVDALVARASDGARAREVALVDDGRHGDGEPGDGVYGGALPAGLSGDVALTVEARALTPEGLPFVRSVPRSFPVLERRVLLDGTATSTVLDAQRLELSLGVHELAPVGPVEAAAEVWGTRADGERVPVAYVSRLAPPAEGRVRLVLDGRWLSRAQASTPLELRAVRLSDPATSVPLDLLDELPLPAGDLPAVVGSPPGPITEEMLTGLTAGALGQRGRWKPRKRLDDEGALLLVHGYCAGGSPWPDADFSEPKRAFLDPNQNRSHDEFARLILDAGADLPSFGVVAHSQGGPAALHLYAHYQSGLDLAQGERRIQSVGAPYQGTPLAELGSFPGVGCGSNFDLSPSGSALWLAGIPTWARAQVHFYSTSNVGSACNFLTNFVLASPNDGVVEQVRTVLPGGDFRGHTLGWCHTTGMSNPAQYLDATRNAEMDAQAAR